MVRWRQYKYVAFRDAPPLFFDLAEDPGEQRNLIARGCSGEAADALAFLDDWVAHTMDFDAAERERRDRDGKLHETYALDLPKASGNIYLFPDGRAINADDAMLYQPTVLTGDPSSAFADWPGKTSSES